MVEHDDVLVENIKHVGGIVLLLSFILHVDILKISHCIEGSVTKQSTVLSVFSFDGKFMEKIIDCLIRKILLIHFVLGFSSVRELSHSLPMFDADTGNRVHSNEGFGIFSTMIIGTFHQCGLRVIVPQFHICAYRSGEIS